MCIYLSYILIYNITRVYIGSDDGNTYVWRSTIEDSKPNTTLLSIVNKIFPIINLQFQNIINNPVDNKPLKRKQVFKNNAYEYFNGSRAYAKLKAMDDNINNDNLSAKIDPSVVPPTNTSSSSNKTKIKVTNSPTTVSLFASSKCLENIILKHPRINNNNKSGSKTSKKDGKLGDSEYENHIANMDIDDLSTRIIITADCDGRMFVMLRGGKF